MISRLTLFSFLLGAMLALGIRMWSESHRDACSAYLDGVPHAASSEWVESGSRLIAVPCGDWFMRMPGAVQILCLFDLLIAAVFLLNAIADLRQWLASRRRLRGLR